MNDLEFENLLKENLSKTETLDNNLNIQLLNQLNTLSYKEKNKFSIMYFFPLLLLSLSSIIFLIYFKSEVLTLSSFITIVELLKANLLMIFLTFIFYKILTSNKGDVKYPC